MVRHYSFGAALACCFVILGAVALQPSRAAAPPSGPVVQLAQPQITQAINPNQLSAMANNVRAEASAANDVGRVADDLALDNMLLLVHRPAAQEQALEQFMAAQTSPDSPNYHNWLTAHQIGQYGPAQSDLNTIASWLQSQGFTVNQVHADGMMIDFSGTAGQVYNSFKTQVHNLNVNGVAHIANMSVPQIPSALAPAVVGIVSINDFRPHTNYKPKPDYTFTNSNGTFYALVPADLATIYNLNPLFNATPTAFKGTGQTIILIEDTNVHSTTDLSTFRSTFNLPALTMAPATSPPPTFTQVHPNNCSNPGDVAGDDGEAEIDIEWAGAAAPQANLELAACRNGVSFGGLIAMQNLNTIDDPAKLWSVSYGECEAGNTATANAAFVSTYQTAAARGVSVFVSAGDEGAASCDADQPTAEHGIGVSGFASTPYNVAVGGTDFGDSFAGTNSTYWNSTNGTSGASIDGSAKSYINEIPWNDSCASVLLATIVSNSGITYGSNGFCNSTDATNLELITTTSGSGGPSGCATGAPSISGIVGGSCRGTAKPSWQSGFLGNPADGVRDIPDISLFAANGIWGHYYVYCYTGAAANGGAACTAGNPSMWSGAGGTSFSSPIMAGIQALINQKTSSSQGNPNPIYYQLAAAEYGASGSSSCNSSNGNAVGSTCIFYDVTQGDMDVNCSPDTDDASNLFNCFRPSGTYGVLSTSLTQYKPAYGTTTGWDFATGIGTVNAANLANNWPGGTATELAFTMQPSASYASAATITVKVSLENSAGTVITSDTSAVTLVLSGGSSGATLGGTTTVHAIAGVATFSNLTVDKAGTGYSLSASDGSLTGASSSTFNITAGAANKLAFTTQPPASTQSGVGFATTVTVQDAAGNTVTGSSASVSVQLVGSGTLSGTTTRNASSGVATFTGLSVDLAGLFALHASSSGLSLATSSDFTITAGPASKLAFTTQPPTSAQSGAPFGATVTVQDAAGNTVTGSSASIALSLSGGTAGATLSGTTTMNASNGGAAFNTLSVDKMGTGFVLNAASASLTSAASNGFAIVPGAASKLAFTLQPPASTQMSKSFAAVVSVEDAAGNVVTSNSSTVTLTLTNNTTGATLTGGSAPAISGLANFNLSVNNAGIGYQLSAADSPLMGATSSAFNITSSTPASITFSVPPSDAVAGVSIAPAIVVNVMDSGSNPVVGDAITLTIANNTGGAQISGGGPVSTDASGNATFSNVSLDKVGTGYTLTAADAAAPNATSNGFDIAVAAASQLAFTTQPSDLPVGGILNTIAVTEEDAFGNVIMDNTNTADFTIAACGGAVDLGSVALVNGVGTLVGSQHFYTAASNLQINASSAGLGGTSASFNVVANAQFIFADGFDGCGL